MSLAPNALHRRLLNDIDEVQSDPYPNVYLHPDEQDFRKACLILSTEAFGPLHLFIEFGSGYPLDAPRVTIQSDIVHPNIYGEYICASMLNTDEGWTPAYTLKGVLIQLLSFFTSASLEQDHGGGIVDLRAFRSAQKTGENWRFGSDWKAREYSCESCGYGSDWTPMPDSDLKAVTKASSAPFSKLLALPDEVILSVLELMPTKDVLSLVDAVPLVKRTVHSYDFIRTRELLCFCLKKSYLDAKLGIGISVTRGSKPVLRSEFDLLSQEAFFQHKVRRSVQGVKFDKWLPLPLTRRHWKGARFTAVACLQAIHGHAGMYSSEPGSIGVLYHLMNTVVVQFSADTEKGFEQPDSRSTLSHASEKAVEAYFACFHLLSCLATENTEIIKAANMMVKRFLAGPRTKKLFPNLGHLLVAALISETGLNEPLVFQIVREAILRNVVWMLDSKGADMAELAYLEPNAISEYRLTKTFEASKTSYRLLMFLKLFASSARHPSQSLVNTRETLFDSHGAPPPSVSVAMAQRIRKIREINGFPDFLRAMGIMDIPSKTHFTTFLRRTIKDSIRAGYSVMPLSQSRLYLIRKFRERDVGVAEGVEITEAMATWYDRGEKWYWNGWNGRPTFFPGQNAVPKLSIRADGSERSERGGSGAQKKRGSRGKRYRQDDRDDFCSICNGYH